MRLMCELNSAKKKSFAFKTCKTGKATIAKAYKTKFKEIQDQKFKKKTVEMDLVIQPHRCHQPMLMSYNSKFSP